MARAEYRLAGRDPLVEEESVKITHAYVQNMAKQIRAIAEREKTSDLVVLLPKLQKEVWQKDYDRYCELSARLSDYVEVGCGNCEAQSKFILSSLTEAGLHWSSRYQIGMQSFRNHLQPVIFDTRTNDVTHLVIGEVVHGIEAPIYGLPIFHCAYLTTQKISLEESSGIDCPNDLLIADPTHPTKLMHKPRLKTHPEPEEEKTNTPFAYHLKAAPSKEQAELTRSPLMERESETRAGDLDARTNSFALRRLQCPAQREREYRLDLAERYSATAPKSFCDLRLERRSFARNFGAPT